MPLQMVAVRKEIPQKRSQIRCRIPRKTENRTTDPVNDTKTKAESQTRKKDTAKPKTPVIKSLTAGKSKLTIRLKGSVPSDVKKYKVSYRIKGKKKWTTKTLKVSAGKIVLKKLKKGKKYQVRLRTVNSKNRISSYSKIKSSKKVK